MSETDPGVLLQAEMDGIQVSVKRIRVFIELCYTASERGIVPLVEGMDSETAEALIQLAVLSMRYKRKKDGVPRNLRM